MKNEPNGFKDLLLDIVTVSKKGNMLSRVGTSLVRIEERMNGVYATNRTRLVVTDSFFASV